MEKRKFIVRKKLAGQKMYRKWEDWAIGDILICKLIGTHVDQYKKECPVVEVLETHFKTESEKYQGKQMVLNQCGILNKAMEQLSIGDIIQITYNGSSMIEKGPYKGKEAHVLDIAMCEEEGSVVQADELPEEEDSFDDL